jgi:hypothetical protein
VFGQNQLDTQQEIRSAQKLGIANLDPKTLEMLKQRGYKY